MAREQRHDRLAAELVALGRDMAPVDGDRVAEAVMERLPAAPPGRRAVRTAPSVRAVLPRRRLVAVVAGVLVALLLTPPVRATLADWFDFAGVQVRTEPGPVPGRAGPPPTVEPGLTLADAAELVSFEPLSLPELGAPDGIEVSVDRRVLSMSWSGGPDGEVRLDQFDGHLHPMFLKTVAAEAVLTRVDGELALWLDRPHQVALLDADGRERTETARLAGHTLIWQRAGTTLRLEGDLDQGRATEIARSAVPWSRP